MRWAEHVAGVGEMKTHIRFCWETYMKETILKTTGKREKNIKMNLKINRV
jgi:hypothetical protein